MISGKPFSSLILNETLLTPVQQFGVPIGIEAKNWLQNLFLIEKSYQKLGWKGSRQQGKLEKLVVVIKQQYIPEKVGWPEQMNLKLHMWRRKHNSPLPIARLHLVVGFFFCFFFLVEKVLEEKKF